MQKVILDTNVIISSLIQRNFPFLIVYHCVLENTVDICLSNELIQEYVDVIHRPKFSKYPDFLKNAEFVLINIIKKANIYTPKRKLEILKDSGDNKLLELALESGANFIITGNIKDFDMIEFTGTKIIDPKTYWEDFAFFHP